MKNKIRYSVLIMLLLCGICFWLYQSFGFFTPYNYFTAASAIKKGKLQIIEVGELPLNFKQKQLLAQSYGFNYQLLGCVASQAVVNGSNYYNSKMIAYLEKKHGAGWWNDFQLQLKNIDARNAEEASSNRAVNLVAGSHSVQALINQVDSLSEGRRHISLLPILKDSSKNIYLVQVGEDNGTNMVNYFNFLVDANADTLISKD